MAYNSLTHIPPVMTAREYEQMQDNPSPDPRYTYREQGYGKANPNRSHQSPHYRRVIDLDVALRQSPRNDQERRTLRYMRHRLATLAQLHGWTADE